MFVCVAEMYLLSEGPESYHYLSQSGCVQDNSLDDQQLFDSVMVGFPQLEDSHFNLQGAP